MAHEWVLIERLSDPIDFTVADGVGIEKGTLMQLTDPRTASAVSASGQIIAGVLAREKIASDGRTRSPLFQSGIFRVFSSGATVLGEGFQSGLPLNDVTGFAGGKGRRLGGTALETIANNTEGHVHLNLGGAAT